MKDFKVRVLRGEDFENGDSIRFGYYVSDVYAIDGTEFLVYDPGDYEVAEGFEWVDFQKTLKLIPTPEEGIYREAAVTLWEGTL